MKLTIIIPYYNAGAYTDELLSALAPQMNEEVEVILVDDGSNKPYKTKYKWCRVIRKENGGCSTARNRGLDEAAGDYISFIDADDLVPDYFIEKLLAKIDAEHPDVIEFSWRSLNREGSWHDNRLTSNEDHLSNPSVCTRAFKRAFIGDVRFNEKKDSTEDEDFSRKIGYLDPDKEYVHGAIADYMYFYRTGVVNSKVKRFKKGLMKTKRVIFHYSQVTKDMIWLLDEIKKEDETNEVYLLTNRCDIPEIRRYCRVCPPMSIWGHYLKGEPINTVTLIDLPIRTQVVVWVKDIPMVSGISTFVYNFCQVMKKHYDILVLYDTASSEQVERLRKIVRARKTDKEILCDTLITVSVLGGDPGNVTYKKKIQMCHTCKSKDYTVPEGDHVVYASKAAAHFFGQEEKVIPNLLARQDAIPALILVSATRLSSEKGWSRMVELGRELKRNRIPFIWYIFSDEKSNAPVEGMIKLSPKLNILPYIKAADYLVQLSDQEAFCYSMVEALSMGIPVITTPMEVLEEIGIEDGVNAYVVPYDMKGISVARINQARLKGTFKYKYDNNVKIKAWRDLIGRKLQPEGEYDPEKKVRVKVTKEYDDVDLHKRLRPGDIAQMPIRRADIVEAAGYLRIMEE